MTNKQCSISGCDRTHYGIGLCAKHYQRQRKHGAPDDRVGHHSSLGDKLERRVRRELIDTTGVGSPCWTWTGFTRKGYGSVWHDGVNVRTHRAAWLLTFGPIPDGLLVCHRCDNPSCVNPDHLFLGTHKDNAADKVAKGRAYSGDHRGTKCARAKLNDSLILAIRADDRPQRLIATDYGIDPSSVSDIKRRKTWAHLPGVT